MSFKYIKFSIENEHHPAFGSPQMVVFDYRLQHDEMWRVLINTFVELELLTAGFIAYDPANAPYVYGKSDSLGVKSDLEADLTLLLKTLKHNT